MHEKEVAPRAGLEPTASGLGILRSVLMSYRGVCVDLLKQRLGIGKTGYFSFLLSEGRCFYYRDGYERTSIQAGCGAGGCD